MNTISKIQKLIKNIDGVNFDSSYLSNLNPDILIKIYNMVQSLVVVESSKNFKEFFENHNYSKNTIKDLELLLKHHYEDKEEGSCPDDIERDIEEIKDWIKLKKMKR